MQLYKHAYRNIAHNAPVRQCQSLQTRPKSVFIFLHSRVSVFSRVHHGLLQVYGLGIAPDTIYNEMSLLCVR